MPELAHFYDEENTAKTNAGVYVHRDCRITGLTADTKYLKVARALFGGDSANDRVGIRVVTADDTTIQTKSEHIMEPQQTGVDDLCSYMFVHSFTTDASPSAVEIQIANLESSTARVDQQSLFLLNLDAIGESGHWDGTVTDDDAAWTDDANIADGDLSTFAFTNTDGSTTSNEIRIAGNTHPTSGNVSEPVTVQFYGRNSASGSAVLGFEVFDGVTSLMSGTFDFQSSTADWTRPFHVPAPSGGWTAAKMESLEVRLWRDSGSNALNVARVDFRTGYVEHAPTNYALASGTDSGSAGEYSTTAATTLIAELDGAALGTDEWVIFGYARADVGSTGRWFDISLHAADDTSTSAERADHRAEGEDTAEQRIVGYAIRHKASSGTPNVTLYGSEEAASGNMLDGGAYLIALPTSLFADFEFDFQSGAVDVENETTIASVGFTPSVNGNHLVFGLCSDSGGGTGLTKLHVEDGTTEIRTGDSTPSHTQLWDTNKDQEGARTFQRHSISAAITLNLRAIRGSAFRFVNKRWLIVVNLNEPAVAGKVPAGLLIVQQDQSSIVRRESGAFI